MKRGDRFPGDQAEIVFSEPFVEYLDGLSVRDREAVVAEVVALCHNPAGSHTLSNRCSSGRLACWNTVDVLAGELDLTRERVRQIQVEALDRLRKMIKRGGIVRDSLL